ncbi:MAG: PAS domain S-box protein, partial [Candidatus Fermentibacteraceae bacterium]
MRDATHRRDEGTLREAYDSQKAHLDHLFASLREAVVLVDNQGTVKEVNPEFERLFGYPREEVLGRNIDDLIAPDDLEEEARDVTESVVEGRRQLLETRRRRRDGSVVDVSVLASPISVGG